MSSDPTLWPPFSNEWKAWLVERRPHESDGRAYRIRLPPAGEKVRGCSRNCRIAPSRGVVGAPAHGPRTVPGEQLDLRPKLCRQAAGAGPAPVADMDALPILATGLLPRPSPGGALEDVGDAVPGRQQHPLVVGLVGQWLEPEHAGGTVLPSSVAGLLAACAETWGLFLVLFGLGAAVARPTCAELFATGFRAGRTGCSDSVIPSDPRGSRGSLLAAGLMIAGDRPPTPDNPSTRSQGLRRSGKPPGPGRASKPGVLLPSSPWSVLCGRVPRGTLARGGVRWSSPTGTPVRDVGSGDVSLWLGQRR